MELVACRSGHPISRVRTASAASAVQVSLGGTFQPATGKRTSETTDEFIQDLRQRVIGTPEISTDGVNFYKPAIRDAFGNRVAHGTIARPIP
jgi:hypothetical protein